jgi:hypothetical protein
MGIIAVTTYANATTFLNIYTSTALLLAMEVLVASFPFELSIERSS